MSTGESAIYGPFEEFGGEDSQKSEKSDGEFDLDEADFFIDEKSPMLSHMYQCQEMLIGMEQIIDDQTHDNLKCILCRVIIKDRYAIVNHLRDAQHQALYIQRFHPVVYKCLVARRETPAVFCDLINRYAIELLTESGVKRCRTYREGHGRRGVKKEKSSKSSKRKKSSPNGRESSRRSRSPRRSRSRSRSRSHRRSRSRNRSPSRDGVRSRNRSASPRRSESSAHRHRHYRHRRDSDGGDDKSRKSSRDRERSVDDYDESDEEDVYGELPADTEISGVLLRSTMAEFQNGEKALVHREMESIKHPLVGLGFITEYSDPRGAYQPGYLCALCGARYSPAQIVQHVRTDKHRLKLMEHRYKNYYATVTLKSLPDDMRKDMIRRYCLEIEKSEGRGYIKRKIVVSENDRCIFRHHKPLPAPPPEPKRPAVDGGPSERASVDPSKVDVVDRRSVPLPPRIRPSFGRAPVPLRPNFIYSEKAEKAKKLAEIEKLLPPFVERNLESGWYSIRQYSLDYYRRLVPPMTPYVSLRCPHATHEIYGTWSPFVMRRIQDQFNFTMDHLTWLQKLLLDWRIPLSKPLEEHELRALADDVEGAVLKALVGHVLQPNNFLDRVHNRVFFEYDDRPTSTTLKKRTVQTIVYESYEEPEAAKVDAAVVVEEVPQRFVRERRPSENSIGSSSNVTPSNHSAPQTRPALLTPTPTDDDQRSTSSSKLAAKNQKAVAERAILVLIDQILKSAKESKRGNPIWNLLLSFDNVRSILFAFATRQPALLQQLVAVMKNPNLVVPPEALTLLEKKLNEMARECERDA